MYEFICFVIVIENKILSVYVVVMVVKENNLICMNSVYDVYCRFLIIFLRNVDINF